MSPIMHGLIAWLFAVLLVRKARDRRLAVIAGVSPDLDGVFILFNMDLYIQYHHTFGHSLFFAGGVAIAAFALASEKKLKVAAAAFGAVLLHMFADYIGSGWPIPPFYPLYKEGFTIASYLSWHAIYVIINPAAFLVCMLAVMYIMYKKEFSPFEFISEKWDRAFVAKLVYPLKYKCHACGEPAQAECPTCKEKICEKHLDDVLKRECTECVARAGGKG